MATRNEKDTTRARANILREFLTRSTKPNRFNHQEIYDVMDLCLSCKGCKSECPSNVDVAKLKAEFLQQYYDANGAPFRSRLIANFSLSSGMASGIPGFYNFLVKNKSVSKWVKSAAGFARQRSLPTLHPFTLKKWWSTHSKRTQTPGAKKIWLFCDEFTNFNDTAIGIKTILLLERLGYDVDIPDHIESGRTWLSKGFLRKSKTIANKNIRALRGLVSAETPLVGIEPSAILTFRDEYPDLADNDLYDEAVQMSKHVFMLDEFLSKEAEAGKIKPSQFTRDAKNVLLHGHCQQKALSSVSYSAKILSLPVNYKVQTIPSGCCGMAGSFGYEKEHYDISMKIGELVLFPAVRNVDADTIIAAPGTSCRHQVKDGTGRIALHPVEVLYEALL